MYQKEFAGCQDAITHVPWSWYKLGFPRAPPSFAASPSSSTPWPIVILLPKDTTHHVQSFDSTIQFVLCSLQKLSPQNGIRASRIIKVYIACFHPFRPNIYPTFDSVLGVHLNGIEYTANVVLANLCVCVCVCVCTEWKQNRGKRDYPNSWRPSLFLFVNRDKWFIEY